MRLELLVKELNNPSKSAWIEHYDENDLLSENHAKDWAKNLILNFNNTLRFYEKPRELLEVKITDNRILTPHSFEFIKTSKSKRGYYYQLHECSTCGLDAQLPEFTPQNMQYLMTRIKPYEYIRDIYKYCEDFLANKEAYNTKKVKLIINKVAKVKLKQIDNLKKEVERDLLHNRPIYPDLVKEKREREQEIKEVGYPVPSNPQIEHIYKWIPGNHFYIPGHGKFDFLDDAINYMRVVGKVWSGELKKHYNQENIEDNTNTKYDEYRCKKCKGKGSMDELLIPCPYCNGSGLYFPKPGDE